VGVGGWKKTMIGPRGQRCFDIEHRGECSQGSDENRLYLLVLDRSDIPSLSSEPPEASERLGSPVSSLSSLTSPVEPGGPSQAMPSPEEGLQEPPGTSRPGLASGTTPAEVYLPVRFRLVRAQLCNLVKSPALSWVSICFLTSKQYLPQSGPYSSS
jgi:hypothetical protein